MADREKMRGPMSLEEYSRLLGQDLSQIPVDLSGLGRLPDIGPAFTPDVPRHASPPFDPQAVSEAVTVQAVRPPKSGLQKTAEDIRSVNSALDRVHEGNAAMLAGMLAVEKIAAPGGMAACT